MEEQEPPNLDPRGRMTTNLNDWPKPPVVSKSLTIVYKMVVVPAQLIS